MSTDSPQSNNKAGDADDEDRARSPSFGPAPTEDRGVADLILETEEGMLAGGAETVADLIAPPTKKRKLDERAKAKAAAEAAEEQARKEEEERRKAELEAERERDRQAANDDEEFGYHVLFKHHFPWHCLQKKQEMPPGFRKLVLPNEEELDTAQYYFNAELQKRLPNGWYEYCFETADEIDNILLEMAALSDEPAHEYSAPQMRFEVPRGFPSDDALTLQDKVKTLDGSRFTGKCTGYQLHTLGDNPGITITGDEVSIYKAISLDLLNVCCEKSPHSGRDYYASLKLWPREAKDWERILWATKGQNLAVGFSHEACCAYIVNTFPKMREVMCRFHLYAARKNKPPKCTGGVITLLTHNNHYELMDLRGECPELYS